MGKGTPYNEWLKNSEPWLKVQETLREEKIRNSVVEAEMRF
jgi:hypothetical protein